MRIPILLALVAVLVGSLATTASADAANEQSCHLLPVVNSGVGLTRSQSAGVLFSENTIGTLDYLKRYHAVALNGVKNGALDSRIHDAFVSSSDPKLAIDWLQDSLRKQFASVTVYNNLDELMQARPEVVVMLDAYSQLLTQRNSTVEARFVAKFYDSNLQYIGKAEGLGTKELPAVWVHDKSAPEIAMQINQQREVQINALKQFDASLKSLVSSGEEAKVAGN